MKKYKYIILFMGILLTACSGPGGITEQPTATPIPPSPAGSPTAAVSPISALTETPTLTPVPPTPVTPTATQSPLLVTSTVQQEIKIFLILLEDNGRSGTLVGCGDSVVPITVFIEPTQGVLRAAMEKMLSAKQQFYGEAGYYNALYQSNLQVASVTIEQGVAIIRLSGIIMLGGTCDAPRLEAQLEQTALQFSTVTDVQVFVNGVLLKDVLSQQ